MSSLIRFNPAYTVEGVDEELTFFLSERGGRWVQDRLVRALSKELTAPRTAEQLIESVLRELVNPELSEAHFLALAVRTSVEVRRALHFLTHQGYLVESEEFSIVLPPAAAAFCHQLGVEPAEALCRLSSTRLAIQSLCPEPREDFRSLLESLGVQVVTEGADRTVVFVDDYLDPRLAEVNEAALQAATPWLLVKPSGTVAWIGPIFDPGKGACWDCLATRLRDNRPVESFIARHKGGPLPRAPLGTLPSTALAAFGMAATEVFKWIVQDEHSVRSQHLLTHDALTSRTEEHPVVQRPQCQTCGDRGWRDPQPSPVVLGRRRKVFTADGGHRICTPEQTLAEFRRHLSPLTGVVRELKPLRSDALNHTYIARHHFVTTFDDLDGLRKNLGGRSSGKGKTDAQARASGFCEAIERYSGVFHGDEPRLKASLVSLGDRAIHPNRCMLFSEAQYQSRQAWNQKQTGWFQRVPEPFDPERTIDWTAAWSLTRGEFRHLPTAYCFYGYPGSASLDCWADSNGCAAGNTIEEAVLQGLMELCERDAVAVWWYNRLRAPGVDLESFDDPYTSRLLEYYRGLGRDTWVVDISSDLGIPTFAAISRRAHPVSEDIILGYGAHLDPKVALGRALTELNQILPSVLTVGPNGRTAYPEHMDPLALEWWRTATLRDNSYLEPDPRVAPRTASWYPPSVTEDIREDIESVREILEAKDLEVLALDQTRPDIGLRVVKVIVPGLRHMWRRLAGGRLYDVPVELGRLPAPLPEAQLNPVPMWM